MTFSLRDGAGDAASVSVPFDMAPQVVHEDLLSIEANPMTKGAHATLKFKISNQVAAKSKKIRLTFDSKIDM